MKVIDAAYKLAQMQSHDLRCRFTGCTCETMIEKQEVLAEFWRQYRQYEGPTHSNDKETT